MSFSAGTYTLPGPSLNTGDTVSATENNTFRNDVATAFNLTWLRNGTAAATADIPMGGFQFTNCAAVGSNGSLLLKSNNGTTAVTIDTAQNMGLGVNPSSWSGLATAVLQGQYWAIGNLGANAVDYAQNAVGNGSGAYKYLNSYAASAYRQINGAHNWFIAPSGTAGTAISFTQAMTLDASARLGIGTTSPTEVLTINNAGYPLITLNDAGTNRGQLGYTFDLGYFHVSSAAALVFRTAGSERARIDSSGNFMRGQTSTGLANSNGVALDTAGYIVQNHSSTSSGTRYAYFGYNGGEIGSITQNGTTGVLYNLTSDYRLKNDQQPLTGAKEFVMALQPKKWQWWDGSGEGVGFIAHEFMEVAKYSGHGEKDAVDEEGNIIPQSIQPSSSEVMANLVALLQEQQAIIEQQSLAIETLTNRITALENK